MQTENENNSCLKFALYLSKFYFEGKWSRFQVSFHSFATVQRIAVLL